MPVCRELGIAVTAYGVLSRGLISGHWQRGDAKSGDFRAMSPRFQEGNVERNLALVEALRRIADAKGVTVAQIAIAWVAAQGEDIVPLIGARRRDRLAEALGSQAVDLDAGDISAIESAVPKNAAAGAALSGSAACTHGQRAAEMNSGAGPGMAPVRPRGQTPPEKVSQSDILPLSKPRLNHRIRCSDVPWLKLSGTT